MLLQITLLFTTFQKKKKKKSDLAIDAGYDQEYIEARGPKATEIKEKVQEEFVKLEVYFQSLNVQTITQTAKYTVRKFVHA